MIDKISSFFAEGGLCFLGFFPARLASESVAGRRKPRKKKINPENPVDPV
jgi:hypothetical protein